MGAPFDDVHPDSWRSLTVHHRDVGLLEIISDEASQCCLLEEKDREKPQHSSAPLHSLPSGRPGKHKEDIGDSQQLV